MAKAKLKIAEDITFDLDEAQLRLDAFDDIVISHPRMVDAKARISSLARQTRSAIARHERDLKAVGDRPLPANELWIQHLVGPTGATKSGTIRNYIQEVYADPKTPPDAIPVLPVTIRSSTKNTRQLQHQILEAFKDPLASTMLTQHDWAEDTYNDYIRKIARKRGTLIVVLDEAHNLLAGGPVTRTHMQKAFKSLVNEGLFSLVICGTEKVMSLIDDAELLSRRKEIIDFSKLKLTVTDLAYFRKFVEYLEGEMLARQVISSPIGLTETPQEYGYLYDMADGAIGVVCRVVRLALERAHLAGKYDFGWEDLAHAYRGWKKETADRLEDPTVLHRHDPFVEGIKPATLEALETAWGALH